MLNQSVPHVSIIICTYQRAVLLRDTLDQLTGVECIGLTEIIVVDNNSQDHTAEVVKQCAEKYMNLAIRYVFEPAQGLSHARNRGIEEAKGRIIAFLDDDALPTKQWIVSICGGFERHPQAAAIGGVIHPNFETMRPDWLIKELELPYTIIHLGDQEMEYPAKHHPFGANMAFRRQCFDTLRFPTHLGRKGASLLSGEEQFLFDQMRKQGMKLLYIPDMVVYHFISQHRLNKRWISERYYYQGVSNAYASENGMSHIGLIFKLFMKQVVVMLQSIYASSDGKKLLNRCRRESIRGTWGTLRMRKEGM